MPERSGGVDQEPKIEEQNDNYDFLIWGWFIGAIVIGSMAGVLAWLVYGLW